MARYNYTDNQPVLIKRAEINGYVVTNPSDELLDANNIGHVLQTAEQPEVTDETKKLSHSYTVENNVIYEQWTIVDKTNQELVDMYKAQIQTIYDESKQYVESEEILYSVTNKKYIPRWVYQFYNTVVMFKDTFFPSEESVLAVSAVDGTSDNMTWTQFLSLYNFISSTVQTNTATQNAQIATLTAKIKELENNE